MSTRWKPSITFAEFLRCRQRQTELRQVATLQQENKAERCPEEARGRRPTAAHSINSNPPDGDLLEAEGLLQVQRSLMQPVARAENEVQALTEKMNTHQSAGRRSLEQDLERKKLDLVEALASLWSRNKDGEPDFE